MSKGGSASSTAGVQQAVRRLERWLSKLETVPEEEVARAARQMYPEMIAQTPFKSGKLEASVHVRAQGQHIEAEASVVSPEGYDYAGIQHDTPSFHHPIQGKAYYIKDPFNHQVELMQRRIRRKLRKRK